MQVTTEARPHRPRRKAKATAFAAPAPWWGKGVAPHLRWPGVTIEIPAVWSRKNARWESPGGQFYFDTKAADDAVRFFPELLTHHIGEFAGQPFELLEYQEKLLTRPIFGWKHAATGYRRFRKLFGFLPKGAGKSPWGAGTGLYLMLCDNEPAAEVYAVAADKAQARVVHDNARIMVEQSPDLLEVCEVLRDSIYHPDSRSKYQVLSSDAKTKHGFRPSAVIFDELHAQRDRKLYEALKKSMVKRRQPFMGIISHAGDDDEGICHEEYEYAKDVMRSATAGEDFDHTCLPVIFEATADDDWTDPRVWSRVNPGHGVTVQHDGIVSECREAQGEPRKLNDFLMYHLNRWVNQAVSWIPVDWWDRCPAALPDDDALRKLQVAAGLDGAQKIDLFSFVLTFREPLRVAETIEVLTETETGEIKTKHISLNYRVYLLPVFWIPENTMKDREREDRVPYSLWQEMGLVIATEGDVIDYDRVFKDIKAMAVRFPLLKQAQIGYDPAFTTDIATKLRAEEFNMVEILQNYKYMSEPCMVMEALLKAKRITHDGNRCMRRCVENVAVKRDDAGRIRPVKPKKAAKRIDGVVAALMGINRLMVDEEQTISYPGRSSLAR
jgi:phage terminase large subunit-like protein